MDKVEDRKDESDGRVLKIGSSRLRRVYHNDSVTGENDHFGTLLFDVDGHMVKGAGNSTWIYTGSRIEGGWVSNVRVFEPGSLETGPRSRVPTPLGG